MFLDDKLIEEINKQFEDKMPSYSFKTKEQINQIKETLDYLYERRHRFNEPKYNEMVNQLLNCLIESQVEVKKYNPPPMIG